MPPPAGGRWSPRRHLPFHLPLALVSPSSCRACQRGEMQVTMCKCSRLKFACLTRDRRSQSGRHDSIQDAVTLLCPGAVQDTESRASEGPPSALEALNFLFAGSGPPSLEEPPQLLQLRRTQRRTHLLAKGVPISVGCSGQIVRNQNQNGPGRQRAQQLGVPLEEHAEVGRQRLRRQIKKDKRLAVVAHTNRKLVSEPTHCFTCVRRERQRRQIGQGNTPFRCEVDDLLPLGRQPLKTALAKDSVEDHQPFNGPAERKWPAVTIVRFSNSLVQRLVVYVEQPRRVVTAAARSRILARDELLKEVLDLLAVRDPREGRIVTPEAHA